MANDSKNKDPKELSKEQDPPVESNGSEKQKLLSNPPPDDNPIPNQSLNNETKEQNGNSSSAFFMSTGTITVTLMHNRTLRHNGIEYKGGTTLELPTKDADHLIKNHYAVLGSLLPQGGIIVPQTHTPHAGSDAS